MSKGGGGEVKATAPQTATQTLNKELKIFHRWMLCGYHKLWAGWQGRVMG